MILTCSELIYDSVCFISGCYTSLRWTAIRDHGGSPCTSGTGPGPDAGSEEPPQVQEHERRAISDRPAARLRGILPRAVGSLTSERAFQCALFSGQGGSEPPTEAFRFPGLCRRRRRRLTHLDGALPSQRRQDPHDAHVSLHGIVSVSCFCGATSIREKPFRHKDGVQAPG